MNVSRRKCRRAKAGGCAACGSPALIRSRSDEQAFTGFSPALFEFLEELADHNHRSWFQQNKPRYEQYVREPALAFIRAFRPKLAQISRFFVASDRRVGGSLFRIYRDTRFFKDKTPYKTNVGIQFRHELGQDSHAPGFYVHLEPGECFLALGVWRPDRPCLAAIRQAIANDPSGWQRVRSDRRFQALWTLEGGSLQRVPREFPADHPCTEDLKRTDYIAVADLEEQDTYRPAFVDQVAKAFSAGRPLVQFLCKALQLPF